ncbi:MAG: hypothetical protein A2V66_03525 [Ignavibacteria bacterium RBG_13_36_8]|nr:MAG: hypothetical protein A2V66_03525 [Ignavibacteria bacterium RBG_13_36_8]
MEIDECLNRIEEKIDLLSINSPRLSRNEAKKFLKVGESKLRYLVKMERIKQYYDEFGKVYYLRSNLMNYLESNVKRAS